jgi:antitoxin CcdA
MLLIYKAISPKKATHLSINSDLPSQARTLNINLSAMLEQALTETLQQRQREH